MFKKYKNPLILAIISGLAIVIYLSVTMSHPTGDNEDSDTVLFLGNKNIAPLVYEEKGVAKGLTVDIVKEISKKTGLQIQIKAMDWQEAQNMVLAGQGDALFQINPNTQRNKLYDFSDILLESEFSIFRDSGYHSIKTVYDLKNKSVGAEIGGYAYYLLQRYDGINIVEIPNIKIGLQMVKNGELDAVVADRWIGEYEIAQSGLDRIHAVDQPIEKIYSRIAVKKGNEELLNIINEGLSKIKEDNTMDHILNEWKGKNVIYFTQERIISIILYSAIGVIIFIMLISLFLISRYRKYAKKLEMDVEERSKELNEANELLRNANLELEKISMIDKLTDIYNRRYFDIAIEKAWEIAMLKSLPLSLIMIDIDRFKIFNDKYGHLAGDQCLKSIANEIKNTATRPGDSVARFGGEEFVVLLPNTLEDGATIVAERIRRKIENLIIIYGEIETSVTISAGVATVIPDESMNPNDLIYAADEALYRAKEAGRNRVMASDR